MLCHDVAKKVLTMPFLASMQPRKIRSFRTKHFCLYIHTSVGKLTARHCRQIIALYSPQKEVTGHHWLQAAASVQESMAPPFSSYYCINQWCRAGGSQRASTTWVFFPIMGEGSSHPTYYKQTQIQSKKWQGYC